MPTKKAYCFNCNTHDEIRRIFEVNSDSKICYCPHCGKKYFVKVAISNYNRVIARYLRRAKFLLKNVVESSYSYSLYGYVLELEPENVEAKLGRVLSLAYMSTVRRNRFIEVKELIDINKEEFRLAKNRKMYSDYLLATNKCIDDYLEKVRKKLTIHTYFYDADCLKTFYKHTKDAIVLKRFLANELSDVNCKNGYEDVFASIKEVEKVYNEVMYTADGKDHFFASFTKSGDVLVTDGQKRLDTKMEKYRMSTLDKKNKKLIVIKDPVFHRMGIKLFKVFEQCFLISGILLTLGIIFLVFYLIFMKAAVSPIFLSFFIVFSVIGLSFIALRIVIGIALKKPKI